MDTIEHNAFLTNLKEKNKIKHDIALLEAEIRAIELENTMLEIFGD